MLERKSQCVDKFFHELLYKSSMQLQAVACESDHNFSRNAFAIVVADDLFDNRRYRLLFTYLCSFIENERKISWIGGRAVARWQPQEENNQMICNYCTTPM